MSISKHEFSDPEVSFQFASKEAICLLFTDDEKETELSGLLRKQDVEVMAEHFKNEWSEIPPSEQGYYWHWNGDKDSAPFMFSILKSGTSGECFIARDQGGFKNAQWCKEYGGYWMKQQLPELPNKLSSAERTETEN